MNRPAITESTMSREEGSPKALDGQQLMTLLKDDASYLRPTLFAVYGVDKEGRPFLGWGMQFGEDEAIFYRPGSGDVSVSTSGDQVWRSHERRGDAHLMWLDD